MTFAEVVRHRRYRWFLAALLLDQVCEALWLVTLGWVASQASSPLWAGTILFAGTVPAVLLMLAGGLWVDRHGTARMAIVTLTLRASVMAVWVALVVTGVSAVGVIVLVAAVVGLIGGVHEPALFTYPTALLPSNRGQAAAVTMERATQRFTQMIGGAFGGFLLARSGAGAPAAIGAVCVLAALGVIVALHIRLSQQRPPDSGSYPSADEGESRGHQIRGGVQFVRSHPVLRYTMWVQCAASVAASAVLLAALPLRSQAEGWTPEQYGHAFAAYGAGVAIATLASFPLQRRTAHQRVLIAAAMAVATGLAVVLVGLAPTPTAQAGAAGLVGLALGPAGPFLSGYTRSVAQAAEEQTGIPVTGRVGSVMLLMTDGAEPLGFLAVAGLASLFPVSVPTVALGLGTAAVAAWCLVRLRAGFEAVRTSSSKSSL